MRCVAIEREVIGEKAIMLRHGENTHKGGAECSGLLGLWLSMALRRMG